MEKNVFDNLVGTLLDIEEKTKDTLKCSNVLQLITIENGKILPLLHVIPCLLERRMYL